MTLYTVVTRTGNKWHLGESARLDMTEHEAMSHCAWLAKYNTSQFHRVIRLEVACEMKGESKVKVEYPDGRKDTY